MSEDLICPFCGDTDFDKIGLKMHLINKWCEEFEKLTIPEKEDIFQQKGCEMNKIKELEQLLKKEKLLRIEAERKLDAVRDLLWELIEDKVADRIELCR